jgi:hypothetical protein
MNVIGKTGTGYMCTLTSEELNFIATGDLYSKVIDPDKLMGRELKIGEIFTRLRTVESFKTKPEYGSVRFQLEELLKGLSKVERFVEKVKTNNKNLRSIAK